MSRAIGQVATRSGNTAGRECSRLVTAVNANLPEQLKFEWGATGFLVAVRRQDRVD